MQKPNMVASKLQEQQELYLAGAGPILVTGGAGYIGTHVTLALLRRGAEVVVLDNFSNSSPRALDRVQELAQRPLTVLSQDLCDSSATAHCIAEYRPQAVVHLAGLKSVNKSVQQPVEYYRNNLLGTANLLEQMTRHGCHSLVFSSSATVYGEATYLPYDEDHPIAPVNPYGRTKHFAEHMIYDWCQADPAKGATILRYFNPVGADASGRIGEEQKGIPDNLMPYIARVATGSLPMLNVFGDDYPTRDGTAERDYIHVSDLAAAHLNAIEFAGRHKGVETFNIGTGHGYTVLEILEAYQRVNNCRIPYRFVPRRHGDVASSVAAVDKAVQRLGWVAALGLDDFCRSTHAWQTANPLGYAVSPHHP